MGGYDKQDMLSVLENFPKQCIEAVKIAAKVKVKGKIDKIVICGMGGSGIGGLLAQKFEDKVPIQVHNDYKLPDGVNRKTLVICSSYSGNTEETLSAYKEAKKKKAIILAITTGGKLGKLSKNPVFMPAGLQPRNALGYSFLILLTVLSNSKLIKNQENNIKDAIRVVKKNKGLRRAGFLLAKLCHGKIPLFYSSKLFEPVAYRIKTFVNESSKQPSFNHFLPELNHNELVGFKNMSKNFEVVFIKDKSDSVRVRKRMDITAKLVKNKCGGVAEISAGGRSLVARFLSTIYVGDYMGYYLGLMNKEDPTPVDVIEDLKKRLK